MSYEYVALSITILLFLLVMKEIFEHDKEFIGFLEDMKKDREIINMVSLGLFTHGGKEHDLSSYYVDELGNLYSTNGLSWEINHKDKRDILICSDKARNRQGQIVNSLRSNKGVKVTIRRKDINYWLLKEKNPVYSIKRNINMTTKRHLTLINKGA